MADGCNAFTYPVPENHKHAIVFGIEIGVSLPIPNYPKDHKVKIKQNALVDTGATGSCVSKKFAQAVKLQYFSMSTVCNSHGKVVVPLYYVDVFLPNGVMFQNIKVTEFNSDADFDFIIGMDILSLGDVSITNAGGKMLFSFRMPPNNEHIDYTK